MVDLTKVKAGDAVVYRDGRLFYIKTINRVEEGIAGYPDARVTFTVDCGRIMLRRRDGCHKTSGKLGKVYYSDIVKHIPKGSIQLAGSPIKEGELAIISAGSSAGKSKILEEFQKAKDGDVVPTDVVSKAVVDLVTEMGIDPSLIKSTSPPRTISYTTTYGIAVHKHLPLEEPKPQRELLTVNTNKYF